MKAISNKNLMPRSPLLFTAVVWLYIDRYDSPGWAIGIIGTITAIFWFAYIMVSCLSKPVDIFKEPLK